MKTHRRFLIIAGAIPALAILASSCSVFGIRREETPAYKVLQRAGNKEIRYYAPYIVAKTTVKGEMKQTQGTAFRRLAGYIFGNNEKSQKMAMTAPVLQEPLRESQPLPMTTPVLQQAQMGAWTMSFVMSSAFSLEQLPVPKDASVVIEQVPARYVAALRYTWGASEERHRKKAEELLSWLQQGKQYQAVTVPVLAGYDPPWTLPFLRRNETMVDVTPSPLCR